MMKGQAKPGGRGTGSGLPQQHASDGPLPVPRLTGQVRLLIVDDEAPQMKALCETLEQEGYATTGYTRASDALDALRSQEFDLLLTDLMMPDIDGIALVTAALEIDRALVCILMTGHGTVQTAVDAMKSGAVDYILKPFTLRTVLPVIARALTVRRLRTENIQLMETVAIYELSMAMTFGMDPGTTLQKTADAAFQQGDASTVSILLPASDGKELYVAVACGENAENIHGRRVPMTYAISNWAVQNHETSGGSREANVHPSPLQNFPESGNSISIPMVAAGKLIGILNVTPLRAHRPIPLGRIKTLNILAGTAASSLHAASLLAELRSAEQRYRRLADNAPDIVFRFELFPQRRYSYVSPAVSSICRHVPQDFYNDPDLGCKVVHPEDRPLVEALFAGEVHDKTITVRWMPLDGSPMSWIEQRHVFVTDDSGRVVAIEGIARDITERMNLEEQLRHAQRMEAVGRLAGGVAHDFNNLLTIINGYGDVLLSEIQDASAREMIQEVRKAGDRAAALTRQLLAFGRKQLLEPHVLQLNGLVEGQAKMLGRLLGEDIELVTVLAPDAGYIKADPGQLEQVLMNLAVNSRDAMPRGGKLTIETANVTLDVTYANEHVSVEPGSYVVLTVTDTGTGMDAATRARIFEPFFTTKELGRGTGLGLSIVYGIIKQSGGNIWVYSELNKGTSFKIYFPRIEPQGARFETEIAATDYPNGSETILVVEDEAVVRQLIRTVLQSAGYKVFEAISGQHALELFQKHQDEIDLVLTDLVMPGLSGTSLAEKVREMQASARFLFTSGYSDEVIVRHGHLTMDVPFIQKPFASRDLLQIVRRTLDHPLGRSMEL